MASGNSVWGVFLACALALALLMGLSSDGWRGLLILWTAFAILCLMALLEPLRRGLAKRGGGLPLRIFAAYVLVGLVAGLLIASLVAAFLSL